MTHADRTLAWLSAAAFVTTAAITASSAWAQTKSPVVDGGIQAASPPPASPNVTGPALRDTLDNCLAFWDAETHMSKAEWRAACQRTVNGTDMGAPGLLGPGQARGYRGRAAPSRR